MAGKLTTHVLDTTRGIPIPGLAIALWLIDGLSDEETRLQKTTTNVDERTDVPLPIGDELKPGIYQLVLIVGHYFTQSFNDLASPIFLDQIPIRFGIADTTTHYHVPLIVSLFFYSTYRGR